MNLLADSLPRLRVLVVDDHPLMRKGIAGVLACADDIEVVAEADDGDTAVVQYDATRPDVTLMDLQMPRCDGVEAIRRIRRHDPEARILALTTYTGDAHALRALEAGASGYLVKTALCQDVAAVVRLVYLGQRFIDPEVAHGLQAGRLQRLTGREKDVLALVARGRSNREVAADLGIAEETVKSYLSNVLQKLYANDRTHAVAIALRRGILQ
jgi:two-component system NarL family response regulator